MTNTISRAMILLAVGVALTGCGYNRGDRAASGGLLGAGVGTAATVMTGGNPLAGALIGGAAGAVGGAVTSHDDINLGRPIWR